MHSHNWDQKTNPYAAGMMAQPSEQQDSGTGGHTWIQPQNQSGVPWSGPNPNDARPWSGPNEVRPRVDAGPSVPNTWSGSNITGPPPSNIGGPPQAYGAENGFNIPFGKIFGEQEGSLISGMVQSAMLEGTNTMFKEMGIGDTQSVKSLMETLLPTRYRLLKRQFDVSHHYVLKKLLVLLCPPLSSYMGSHELERSSNVPTEQYSDARDLFGANDKDSSNYGSSVDLYIPVINVMTYVVLCGCQKGITGEFHPEVLQYYLKVGCLSWLMEAFVAVCCYYFAAPYSDLSFLAVTAISGYKFFYVNLLILLSFVLPQSIPSLFWIAFTYQVYSCCHSTILMIRGRSIDANNELENDYSSAAKKESMRRRITIMAVFHSLMQMAMLYLLSPIGFSLTVEQDTFVEPARKLGGPASPS